MTLILGMSKPEGIYLSTDYRATDARSGTLVDDASIKFLTVHYPPDKTGPKALFGCTGLGILPDGTPTGAWLRETLRGETEVIDHSMAHLRERLDRDVAPLGYPLIVNVLVLEPERRLFGGFSNLKFEGATKTIVLLDSFGYTMTELEGPFWFANGSGAFQVPDRDRELLAAQISVVPRKPLDHMKLLASVNRRTAQRDQAVSPFCQVSFINSDERTSPASHVSTERGEEVPFAMPVLLFGIDLSDMALTFHERATAVFRGEATEMGEVDPAEMNKKLKRRP